MVPPIGFLTFGENSAGFLLDNYSVNDGWASFSRFGVSISVLSSYPLLFLGARDGCMALTGRSSLTRVERTLTTIGLEVGITILAVLVNDLTFVLSLNGATLSAALAFIFPPIMLQTFVKVRSSRNNVQNSGGMKAGSRVDDESSSYTNPWEVQKSYAALVLGVVIGVMGAAVTIVRILSWNGARSKNAATIKRVACLGQHF